jgi:hypothetical protein
MDDVARANVPRPDAPQITGFSRARAPAGARIVISGRGLGGASRVIFAPVASGGRTWQKASFRVRDDGHLIVTVPDLGPDEQQATVVVVTPQGAAVTVPTAATLVAGDPPGRAPRDRGGFFFVSDSAAFTPPAGATVFVDRGATVRFAAGSLLCIRAGGGADRVRGDCLILRESRNPQPRDLSVLSVLDVSALNACFVDSLFQYAAP